MTIITTKIAGRHEEELFPWYTPEEWYPVRIGEVFNSRYKILLKLGYGSVSTAWLCRDQQECKYVTLKVYATGHRQARNEHRVLEHLKAIETTHGGKEFIRLDLDRFSFEGKRGTHQCLVHKPLAKSLYEIRRLCNGPMPMEVVKLALQMLLFAIDFLHREAGVIHTDIGDDNIMVETLDDSYWGALEQREQECPSARKVDGDRIIYASAELPMPSAPGRFVLCDFGDAQFGHEEFCGQCQPDVYRAPEMVVWAPFTRKIDIWNIGMLAWTLVEGKHLFPITDYGEREASSAMHLAQTIQLLGPPPVALVKSWRRQGKMTWEFFDEDGNFTPDIPLATRSFEEREAVFEGQEKTDFLAFIRRMLRWDPEERSDAQELLQDRWLRDLPDVPDAPEDSREHSDASSTGSLEGPSDATE